MHRGFNLFFDDYDHDDYKIGLDLYSKHKDRVGTKIGNFKNIDGTLNGSKMQANWFPPIKADVFISHSHADQEIAISLAGWLWKNFKIRTFIDSCVWDYAGQLLQMIDNKYSKIGTTTFSYEKSNLAASHVHMMLSVALSRMIDSTECVFFLNTPQSITPLRVIDQTVSPWIYSEIEMTRLVRKRGAAVHRIKKFSSFMGEHLEKGGMLALKYDVDLSHLTKLNKDDLDVWEAVYAGEKYALDILYDFNPITL